ncbi:MAG: hypothetical protein HZB13_21960 [Acidobacteria bacterium]|nr:hypothetical protein [Acidobacteriota bacterium]
MSTRAQGIGLRSARRGGMVLIAFAVSLALIFGFLGLAVDVGRLYLARNEAQAFADAGALAAAVMLDGEGFGPAISAVAGTYMTASSDPWKAYHFQTTPFTDYTVKFSVTGADGTFLPSGSAPANSRFVEVVATTHIPMSFSTVLLGISGDGTSPARARAVAGQVLKTIWDEGLVPFAPWAHCSTTGEAGFPACVDDPPGSGNYNVNMTAGQQYALRWQANTFSQSFKNYASNGTVNTSGWCGGDQEAGFADSLARFFTSGAAKDWDKGRGYWTSGEVHGANEYRMLVQGSMGAPVELGDPLTNFDGKEPQQVSALFKDLNDKAALGDPGNLVFGPVVDPVTGAILGYREFRLIPGYKSNDTWCAEYTGVSVYGPGTDPVNQNGIYEVRLVR